MRQIALTAITVLTGGILAFAGPESLPTSGKEMKNTVMPVPACDFNWTGFYLGARAGGGWAMADTDFDPLPDEASFGMLARTVDLSPSGFIGGGELGFNLQLNKWFVLGAETDFSGTTIDDSKTTDLIQPDGSVFSGGFLHTSEDINWLGSTRGRIGISPWCRLLIYGTGGVAYGGVDYRAETLRNSDYRASKDDAKIGWVGGAGVEYGLTPHWTIKVEYLYYDLGDESATGNPIPANPPFQVHYNWDTQVHTVNAGINFKF